MFKGSFCKGVSIKRDSADTSCEVVDYNRLKGIYAILREKFEEDENPGSCENGDKDGEHGKEYELWVMNYGLFSNSLECHLYVLIFLFL